MDAYLYDNILMSIQFPTQKICPLISMFSKLICKNTKRAPEE